MCGADSDLVAAPEEDRLRLAAAAQLFSEEDLTRFFEILLSTEEDLRRKPDPRLHLEMGMLRLVNAARLAPLEEILGELSRTSSRSSETSRELTATATSRAVAAERTAVAPAPTPQAESKSRSETPPAMDLRAQVAAAAAAAASARLRPLRLLHPVRRRLRLLSLAFLRLPHLSRRRRPDHAANAFTGIDGAQVADIKSSILSQQKFLGELVEHATRWELEGAGDPPLLPY